ncbi:unnamed protein product [Blepharisma stoltei]|uniref:Uncharacterized protein n=1 Tax=Blepharisma stoltei TaxID=1481888 RepID=A0AAU9JSS2_9CILI|nr:unnamed protein product [Blepharisma stoltei]
MKVLLLFLLEYSTISGAAIGFEVTESTIDSESTDLCFFWRSSCSSGAIIGAISNLSTVFLSIIVIISLEKHGWTSALLNKSNTWNFVFICFSEDL